MSRDITFTVMSTHHKTRTDGTPLRMVSEAQLEHYRMVEADYLKLLQHRGSAEICTCGKQNADSGQDIGDHVVTDKTQEIKGK